MGVLAIETHGVPGIDVEAPPPGMHWDKKKAANPQAANFTHMGDHLPPMTPLTSRNQKGLPILSLAHGAPPPLHPTVRLL